MEEAVLCLLILEEDVRNCGFVHRRDKAELCQLHKKISLLYSHLLIALRWRGQLGMLQNLYEQALQFSFEESFLWFQFALILLESGQTKRTLLVLKECIKLSP